MLRPYGRLVGPGLMTLCIFDERLDRYLVRAYRSAPVAESNIVAPLLLYSGQPSRAGTLDGFARTSNSFLMRRDPRAMVKPRKERSCNSC